MVERGGMSTAGRPWALVVGCLTLLVPLALIVGSALTVPLPAAPAPGPAPVAEVVVEPPAEPPTPPVELAPAVPAPPPPAPMPAPLPFNPFPSWTRESQTTFLLLGIDRRPDEEVFRTDSIILGSIDLRTKQGTAISIPRDLVVNIPGYSADRINTVYALGELDKKLGGPALLRQTIERNFGVRVDHYAIVDFGCFRGAIDALGGVQVNVTEPIYDPLYPTDDYGYKVVRFSPGPQWLGGEQALEYARTRHGDNDFYRMRRQQQLLTAVRDRALQVQSLAALPRVAGACSGMASDLGLLDLVALGAQAREIRQSDITQRVIDERMAIPYTAPSGAAVLLPRWDQIRAMVRSAMPGVQPVAVAADVSFSAARSALAPAVP